MRDLHQQSCQDFKRGIEAPESRRTDYDRRTDTNRSKMTKEEADFAEGGPHPLDPTTKDTTLRRKIKPKNPILPLGALATVATLGGGFRSFLRADHIEQQRWMQQRVVLQAATISLLLIGVYMGFK